MGRPGDNERDCERERGRLRDEVTERRGR